MSQEVGQKIIIRCPLRFTLKDNGLEIMNEEAYAEVDEENVHLLPKFSDPILFSLREIVAFVSANYRLTVGLTSGETIILSHLGYRFEDFERALRKARNELYVKDMLIDEPLLYSGIEAECIYLNENSHETQELCELRLYETELIFMPMNGRIFKIHYSDISACSAKDYVLIIETDTGRKIYLTKLGSHYRPLQSLLSSNAEE